MAFGPRNNKFEHKLPVFDGGLNTQYTDVNTPENQTPDCQNVVFDDFGAVGTVIGYSRVSTYSVASAAIDGIHQYKATEAELHVAANKTLFKMNPLSKSWITNAIAYGFNQWASAQTSYYQYIQNEHVNYVNAGGFCIACSNGSRPMKYWPTSGTTGDGSYLSPLGVSAVSLSNRYVTPGFVVAASMSSGPYRWAITVTDHDGNESDYTIIASSISWDAFNELPAEVYLYANSAYATDTAYLNDVSPAFKEINLYRNKSGNISTLYLVTSMTRTELEDSTRYLAIGNYSPDNGLIYDYTPDSDLGPVAPSDNGTPPHAGLPIYHRNRMFLAGNSTYPSRLWWSNSGNINVWETTSYIDIGEGDGMPIVGLAVYGNALFVHKNDGLGHGALWAVYMPDSFDVTDSSNWYVDKVAVFDAAAGQRCIVFYENLQVFVNRYGVFALAGQDLAQSPAYSKVGTFPTNSLSYLIEQTVKSMNPNYIGGIAAINYDNKLWFAIPSTKSSVKNDKMLVWDYQSTSKAGVTDGAWSLLDGPSVSCFATYNGDLVAGSSLKDGAVYKLLSGTSANGSAINSYFRTVWIYGKSGHQDNTKVWRFLHLWYETSGNWTITVEYWTDSDSGSIKTTTFNLGSGEDYFGTGVFGTATFGDGAAKKYARIILDAQVGRAIQVKFSTNTADQYWKIYSMQLDYNLRRIR